MLSFLPFRTIRSHSPEQIRKSRKLRSPHARATATRRLLFDVLEDRRLLSLSLSQPIDLGDLAGGGTPYPSAINASGQVVGGVGTAATSTSAYGFLYSHGKMSDLGTLGGASSNALGVNDNGNVVGYATTADGDLHAFLYSNGAMIDLNNLLPAGSDLKFEIAYGINDSDQIVGVARDASDQIHAVLYGNGALTDLGCLIGLQFGVAYGINASGEVVGVIDASGDSGGAAAAVVLPARICTLSFIATAQCRSWVRLAVRTVVRSASTPTDRSQVAPERRPEAATLFSTVMAK